MAVRTREEIINAVRTRLGEAPDDDGVILLEDLEDTFNDYDGRIPENYETERNEWNTERQRLLDELEENDRQWRTRYAERFGGSGGENKTVETSTENLSSDIDETEITFDDLFNNESEE